MLHGLASLGKRVIYKSHNGATVILNPHIEFKMKDSDFRPIEVLGKRLNVFTANGLTNDPNAREIVMATDSQLARWGYQKVPAHQYF